MQESLPAECMAGDIDITLDSGQQYRVHEMKLWHASDFLEEMLRQVQPPEVASEPTAMALPDVPDRHFHILMHALYASDAATWAHDQSTSQLWDLAKVSHRLGCAEMFALADKSLVRQSLHILYPTSAIELCREAQRLGMKGMQYESAIAITSSLPQLSDKDLAAAAELVPPIFSAARAEVIDMLLDIEGCNEWGRPHASQGSMLYRAQEFRAALQARMPLDGA